MLKLLLEEPNVLLLDEPTNDLDIETLNVLEDFLDGWPGTLVVVSHDRYFLERVCDSVWALLDDGKISMLPRGVDEYLERREAALRAGAVGSTRPEPSGAASAPPTAAPTASQQEIREARKALARVEKQLAKATAREEDLHAQLAEHAADYAKLAELHDALREVAARKEALEEEWLEAAAVLE
jgi:ATP-binding cassette subfamily F protein uup